MAFIGGMSGYGGGGVSSIYGNRNVLSGLASGMDTESMIENAISGYKMKINALKQKRTIEEWKQNSYRDIIEKMAKITDKYTSYSSPTNLMSSSFFNSAVNVTTQGTYADKISATGRTDSDVQILGVKQLATSATHKVTGIGGGGAKPSFEGSKIDLNKEVEVSQVAGNMTINYGGNSKITINFAEDEVFKSDQMDKDGYLVDKDGKFVDAEGKVLADQSKPVKGKTAMEKMKDAMVEKLSKENITIGENTYKASERIEVEYDAVSKKITLKDKSDAKNAVYVSGASEDQQKTLGIDLKQNNQETGKFVTSFGASGEMHKVDGTVGDKLSGQEIQVTLDGVTRTIKLPKYNSDPAKKGDGEFSSVADLAKSITDQLGEKFGSGKVTVTEDAGKLKFTVNQEGSSLSVSSGRSTVTNSLGLKDRHSTFIDTQKNLGQIWGEDKKLWEGLTPSEAKGDKDGNITTRKDADGNMYKVDAEGYRLQLKEGKDEKSMKAEDYIRVDDKGNALYDFKVNNVRVGSFNADTELNTVLQAINGNTEAGVSVSYSRTTDQFTFTARDSGAAGKVELNEGLASKMFGAGSGTVKNEAGKDAILSMKVNGEVLDGVTRSDNNFTVDGLNITLKDVFGDFKEGMTEIGAKEPHYVLADQAAAAKDAVTFKSSADSDKIVDAVKEFVKDFNEMMTTLKSSFSTLPAQNSNGKPYLPLTDEDRKEMGETAAKEYEEKAKQGILFADRELSSLYDRLRQAISMGGKDGDDMRSIGLSVEYSNGLSTLKLDEDALRNALNADPDKVRDVFSKTAGAGSQTDGLMQAIKKPLDTYGKVSGGKGVLVELAGSPLAPTTLYNNTLYQKMNRFDQQILDLEKKMNRQVDRYTHQFTQMEQLIAQMNSQSGALAGLMGGF